MESEDNMFVSKVDRGIFTLIELLVCVAVIALLTSILLPALGKARGTALRIICVNNMKQVHLGAMGYGNDYQQFLPPWYDNYSSGPRVWYRVLGDNKYVQKNDPVTAGTTSPAASPLVCPSYQETINNYGEDNYAWNGYIYCIPGYTDNRLPIPLFKVTNPSLLPMLNDAKRLDSLSGQWFSFCTFTCVGAVGFHHHNQANFLFYDGHVEPFKMGSPPVISFNMWAYGKN